MKQETLQLIQQKYKGSLETTIESGSGRNRKYEQANNE